MQPISGMMCDAAWARAAKSSTGVLTAPPGGSLTELAGTRFFFTWAQRTSHLVPLTTYILYCTILVASKSRSTSREDRDDHTSQLLWL
jgi:hypothetical protein